MPRRTCRTSRRVRSASSRPGMLYLFTLPQAARLRPRSRKSRRSQTVGDRAQYCGRPGRAARRTLDPVEVAVVTGGPEVADRLTSLPFDHLVFTGSTTVGKLVMANAAKNLVPVTLELGGKSPSVLSRSAGISSAASRLAIAKSTNAGQLCVSPDLIYVHARTRKHSSTRSPTSSRDCFPRSPTTKTWSR